MIINGDCLTELDKMQKNSVDAIVTDPPYELNFMGKGWDNAGVSFKAETWEKCLNVLKPGGYLLAFGGSRTFHRIACAIEDAGFEIRDTIMWLYGSGFPKSMNIGLAIDKKNGVDNRTGNIKNNGKATNSGSGCYNCNNGKDNSMKRLYEERIAQNRWNGWGTALKPSFEPIIIARKPFKGSLVDNVIEYGVGGINVDECRVETNDDLNGGAYSNNTEFLQNEIYGKYKKLCKSSYKQPEGRFPANTILTYDETDFDEVCGGFPNTKSVRNARGGARNDGTTVYNKIAQNVDMNYECGFDDSGSAARYFYCAKASKKDRDDGLDSFSQEKVNDGRQTPIDNPFQRGETPRRNTHPTVKPTSLMQYLVRLVAPKNATVLDPFLGSGSTGKAIEYENKERDAGYKFIGIEKDVDYCRIAEARIGAVKIMDK